MTRQDPQINLRLPKELQDRVRLAAIGSHRSISAEFVFRLEQSFFEPSAQTPASAVQLKHAAASDLLERCDPRDLVELVCRLVPLLDRDKLLNAIRVEKLKNDASVEGIPKL